MNRCVSTPAGDNGCGWFLLSPARNQLDLGSTGRSSGFAIDLPQSVGASHSGDELPTPTMNLQVSLHTQMIRKRLITELCWSHR